MLNLPDVASAFSFVNFGVATILGAQALLNSRKFATFEKWGVLLFGLATFSITIAFFTHGITKGWLQAETYQLGIVTGLSLVMIPCFFWFGIKPILAYSSFVAALILGVYLLDVLSDFGGVHQPPNEVRHVFVGLHIVGAIMGQIFALVASMIAMMYLWQKRILKRKMLIELSGRMPSLELLAKLIIACIWAGFLFLTAALLSGIAYLDFAPSMSKTQQNAKVIWAIFIWVWYLVALIAKYAMSMPTKKIAQMCLGGFVMMALASFGLSFFATVNGGG